MTTKRLFQSIILLSVLGLVYPEARAEPMLLIEIRQEGGSERNFIGEPVAMAFRAGSDDGPLARIEGSYTASDVGMTFHADATNVGLFDIHFHSQSGGFALDNSTSTPTSLSVDELWNIPPTIAASTLHVPRLGYGLTGYDLTSVTQTIDRLEYLTSGNRIVSLQTQTIRLYGQMVPEPGSLMVMLIHALIGCAAYRRNGRVGCFVNKGD